MIVGAYHDLLGTLFWVRPNETNETERYELTADIDGPHRFDIDELDAEGLLSSALDCGSSFDRFIDRAPLSERAVISPAAFAQWVASTAWLATRTSIALSFMRQVPKTRWLDSQVNGHKIFRVLTVSKRC